MKFQKIKYNRPNMEVGTLVEDMPTVLLASDG